jgi:hypothetical protein
MYAQSGDRGPTLKQSSIEFRWPSSDKTRLIRTGLTYSDIGI